MTYRGKSRIDGTGVIATLPLNEGTLVGRLKGTAKEAPTQRSLTICGKHIDPDDDCVLKDLNHSCRPTAKMDGYGLFLREPVDRGDEITINYLDTEDIISYPFTCNCGNCGKVKIVGRLS